MFLAFGSELLDWFALDVASSGPRACNSSEFPPDRDPYLDDELIDRYLELQLRPLRRASTSALCARAGSHHLYSLHPLVRPVALADQLGNRVPCGQNIGKRAICW